MIRHASSHAFAVLGTTIISALLIDLVRPLFPSIINAFEDNISLKIIQYFNLDVSPRIVTILILSVILGFFWGAFFKYKFDKT